MFLMTFGAVILFDVVATLGGGAFTTLGLGAATLGAGVPVRKTCDSPLHVQRQCYFDCFLWRQCLIYVGICVLCRWQWSKVDGY